LMPKTQGVTTTQMTLGNMSSLTSSVSKDVACSVGGV
jgi:hypothetical protein